MSSQMSQDWMCGSDGGSQNLPNLGAEFYESQVVWDETTQILGRTPSPVADAANPDVPPPPPAVQDDSEPLDLEGLCGPPSLLPDIDGAGGLPLQSSTQRELDLEKRVKELEEGMAAYQQLVYKHGEATYNNLIQQLVQPELDRLQGQIAALNGGIQDMSGHGEKCLEKLERTQENIASSISDLELKFEAMKSENTRLKSLTEAMGMMSSQMRRFLTDTRFELDKVKTENALLKAMIPTMSQQAAEFVPELQQVRAEIEALTNDLRPNPRKDVDTQTDTQTPTQVNGDELISMPATPVTPGGDGARESSSTSIPATPPSPGGNETLTAPPDIALGVPVELQGEPRAQRVKGLRELSDLGRFISAGEKNQPVDGMRKRPKTAFFGR